MKDSTLSRRLSEFVGVVLFAAGLIWLISLVSHEPTDPVWFFTTDATHAPANFVGRVGAFLSELSLQLFGYAAYLIPGVIAIVGWHYFWCQKPDAAYTKVTGAALLFGCSSAFLSLIFGSTEVAGKSFDAGGSIGAPLSMWSTAAGTLRLLAGVSDVDHPAGSVRLFHQDVLGSWATTHDDASTGAILGTTDASGRGYLVARTASGTALHSQNCAP